MAAQLVLFILGIVSFVAAVVLAGLAIFVYRRDDIRAVRDDLSGKTRQQDIEQSSNSTRDRRSQRAKAAELKQIEDARAEKRSAKGAKAEKAKRQEKPKRKRKGKASQEASPRTTSSATEKRTSKSVADYQAEYTKSNEGRSWDLTGEHVGGSPERILHEVHGAESDGAVFEAEKPKANAHEGMLDEYLEKSIEKLAFRVTRREMVVNWQEGDDV